MCGGRGSRLGDGEKPLRPVGGIPMVRRVADALAASSLDRIYAVTSPKAPETTSHLEHPAIETAGEGYVADLQTALADDRISRPVLTVAADLPLLDGPVVDALLADHHGGSLTLAVPVGRVRALGFSVDATVRHGSTLVRPAGLNVVGEGSDALRLTRDRRAAANVNRPRDLHRAEWLVATNRSTP